MYVERHVDTLEQMRKHVCVCIYVHRGLTLTLTQRRPGVPDDKFYIILCTISMNILDMYVRRDTCRYT